METFLLELRRRNALLFWFGIYNFIIAFICLGLLAFDHTLIAGEYAYAKPFKYALSTGLISWNLGWIMFHLSSKKIISIISWVNVVSMFVVVFIISFQSFRGIPSYYNISTPLNAMLYSILGSFDVVFLLLMIFVTISFFRQKKMPISQHYTWGIRMGLLLFVLFSFVGIMMMSVRSHTIGGLDGEKGLYFLNWSLKHGDLRIIQFMGINALPIMSLSSYYAFKKKNQVLLFSFTYFLLGLTLFILTIMGIPLIPIL